MHEHALTYDTARVGDIEPHLLRDLNTRGKEWVVVRTSPNGRRIVWSFHSSRALAAAACRRWRSRDIVTR